MNLVLITESEAASGFIPAGDPRAVHLLGIVGLKPGGVFFAGIPNGLRGKAEVSDVAGGIRFSVTWEKEMRAKLPLTFVVGLPRPQTAKRVLFDLTTLGVSEIRFFKSDKGDPAYATATLWRDGGWRDEVMRGAEQAFSTLLPEVVVHGSLDEALASVSCPDGYARVAPDVYEATEALGPQFAGKRGALIAVGPERGWSGRERESLKKSGFVLAHLGARVLRVETACVAAASVAAAQTGVWESR